MEKNGINKIRENYGGGKSTKDRSVDISRDPRLSCLSREIRRGYPVASWEEDTFLAEP